MLAGGVSMDKRRCRGKVMGMETFHCLKPPRRLVCSRSDPPRLTSASVKAPNLKYGACFQFTHDYTFTCKYNFNLKKQLTRAILDDVFRDDCLVGIANCSQALAEAACERYLKVRYSFYSQVR